MSIGCSSDLASFETLKCLIEGVENFRGVGKFESILISEAFELE